MTVVTVTGWLVNPPNTVILSLVFMPYVGNDAFDWLHLDSLRQPLFVLPKCVASKFKP